MRTVHEKLSKLCGKLQYSNVQGKKRSHTRQKFGTCCLPYLCDKLSTLDLGMKLSCCTAKQQPAENTFYLPCANLRQTGFKGSAIIKHGRALCHELASVFFAPPQVFCHCKDSRYPLELLALFGRKTFAFLANFDALPTRLGKEGYAPEEQMRQGKVFLSRDLYALAVTALVLLMGKEPQELTESTNGSKILSAVSSVAG